MAINTDASNMQKSNKLVDYKESEIWKVLCFRLIWGLIRTDGVR